jgi:hypothetical protein
LDQIQKREALKRNRLLPFFATTFPKFRELFRLLVEAEEFDIHLAETSYARHILSLVERTSQEQAVFDNLHTSLCKSNYELHIKSTRFALEFEFVLFDRL